MTSDFQGKTLNRVTSGLRIVQSGDDAAGLAIANGFRSDQAVLSQGVRNANDGLSTLQTIDGGMSNISKLLDRARTLATQSASGTFTGDRGVLNTEFQSVMQEINRQSQAIGMDKGGQFAKNLSVFVGGGKGATDSATLQNGSVGIDLSKSTVDVKSLGLENYRATSSKTYDLGTNSATSVGKIIANQGTGVNTATFTFRGSGFGVSTSEIKVSISTQGITDTAGLATAINNAIYEAANPGTETTASKAFKAAGITASVITDSTGKQQLAFSSSSTAFQVHGDQLANAFMGFVADSRVSKVTGEGATYIQGGSTLNPITADLSSATIDFTDTDGNAIGSQLAFDSTMDGNSGTISTQDAVDNINTLLGDSSTIKAELKGGKLAFYSTDGTEFNVKVAGDVGNALGLIDATVPRTAGTMEGSVAETTLAAPLDVDYTSTHLKFTDADGNALTGLSDVLLRADGSTTAYSSAAVLAAAINQDLIDAGGKIRAEVDAAGTKLHFYSTDGSGFSVKVAGGAGDTALGYADAANLGVATAVGSTYTSKDSKYQALTSGGVYQSTQSVSSSAYTDYSNSAYDFTALGSGDSQTVSVNTKRADGTIVSLDIKLDENNADTLSNALDTINQALQDSSDESLKTITAIRDQNGVRFIGTQGFSVTLGDGTNGSGITEIKDGATKQADVQLDATVQGGSGLADISSQSSAASAVAALAKAVQSLGTAQAAVGKGQNQFNYAVNLAQSQLSNLAAAESRIRDADLAAEAANMTKAQILLQAGVAALAQANSAPQQILSLLRG